MKIIALMPAKNESWILPTTLPQLKRFVDHIILLDGHSDDSTVALARSHGVEILEQPGRKADYSLWRQTLLDRGREQGGTHFVWLDADEAFTSNFHVGFR